MKRKFIIAGGGTGGHIYPGIAIAKALESLSPDLEVEFVGSQLGLETQIVPREGFVLHVLAAGKLNYQGSLLRKIVGLIKVMWGLVQAFLLLRRLKPVGVLGVGGYASGPLVLAAALLRIPTAIWEPNAHPGLTNRWLSRFVSRAFIVFENARAFLKSENIQVLGLPVRSELEKLPEQKRAVEHFHVLCFGGSQGARALNTVLKNSVDAEHPWLYKSHLIHQTGPGDYQEVKAHYENSIFEVEAFEYLFEMDRYYDWADVVICRAGASTLAELSAVGKPAILVPLPSAADDHQRKNAVALSSQNAAIVIEQKDFTPEKLNEVLLGLQNSPDKLVTMAKNVRNLYKPKAAESIASILISNLVGK